MITPKKETAGRGRRGGRGFALITTVLLLAFAVLLLVSVASLTRVETSVATNYQNLAKARQNALMGLNIAIGQLQKHAGPDQRVTAADEKTHYTGVWNTNNSSLRWSEPQAWLVSGNSTTENGALKNGTATLVIVPGVSDGNVTVPRVEITSNVIKGYNGQSVTTGRYAYWVGDQGVKAPVAHASRVGDVDYAPWDTPEAKGRLWARVFSGAGTDLFWARNATLLEREGGKTGTAPLEKIMQLEQLPLLNLGALGGNLARERFHDWSADNFSVIANTANGSQAGSDYTGLRLDLSRVPGELGAAFVRYAGLDDMETPGNIKDSALPAALPEITRYSSRRRYNMSAPVEGGVRDAIIGGTLFHAVRPVLTAFYITFGFTGIRPDGNLDDSPSSAMTASTSLHAEFLASFWNPYTSAIVPPSTSSGGSYDLWLRVSGLPTISATGAGIVNLQEEFQSASDGYVRINLPFKTRGMGTSSAPDSDEDVRSWLPGRTYYWTSGGHDRMGDGKWDTAFYDRSPFNDRRWIIPKEWDGGGVNVLDITESGGVSNLKVELMQGDAVLATYEAPDFQSFSTTDAKNSTAPSFAYPFRLDAGGVEYYGTMPFGRDPNGWLKTSGRNPVEPVLGKDAFVPFVNDENPASYSSNDEDGSPLATASTNRRWTLDSVFNRAQGTGSNTKTYLNDAPVFELPREPILSVGELQHMHVKGGRPFTIGNWWGGHNGTRWNKLFDQYFFTGLTDSVNVSTKASGDYVLPNHGLVPVCKADGTLPTPADIKNTTGNDSRHVLQSATFNINSESVEAWTDVLRGMVGAIGQTDVVENTGTVRSSAGAGGTDVVTSRSVNESNMASSSAFFTRFPQSFQETASHNTSKTLSYGPNRSQFRSGYHLLNDDNMPGSRGRVGALAEKIVNNIKEYHKANGPFRSLEEFLGPYALFTNTADGKPRSVLQQSINDYADTLKAEWVRDDQLILSSSMLQGDLLVPLAPVLYARSDTFIVRAYGETVNPATGALEGRAWCEATMQRFPEPFSGREDDYKNGDPAFGRRFKMVSFRWLNEEDL